MNGVMVMRYLAVIIAAFWLLVAGHAFGAPGVCGTSGVHYDTYGNPCTPVYGISGGGGGNAAAGNTGSTVPAYADYLGFLSSGNLVGVSAANPLPITGSISATNPSVSATGTAAPGSATYLGFLSGGNLVGVSAGSALPVSAASLPLPSGAATSALQTTINTTLGTLFQAGGSIGNAAFGVTGNVTVTPKAATNTYSNCAVTTSSSACLAASSATNHLTVQNVSASATLTCMFGGTPVANTTGFQLSPGQSSTWGMNTGGAPTLVLNCLGSAAGSLYMEYN